MYWDQLKTGDCFKGFADRRREAPTSVTRVDCRSMHEEEVTGTFNLPGQSLSGRQGGRQSRRRPLQEVLHRYVGIDWDSSAYNYDYLTPAPRTGGRGTAWSSAWPMTLEHRRTNKISLRNVKE